MGLPDYKSQSAIEFLATHTWSLIVIMIVLAGLFWLGIFGGQSLNPRGPPGECAVYRPNGQGTITDINLAGICNNQLPKFVSHFGYPGPFQNFGSSNVSVSFIKFMPTITNNNGKQITISAWILARAQENTETAFAYGNFTNPSAPYNGIYLNINESPFCNNGMFVVVYANSVCMYSTGKIPTDKWLFVAIEYNGTNLLGYTVISAGNVLSVNTPVTGFTIPPHGSLLIATPWNGLLTNIQLYNASLSKNSVLQLYGEGLGGDPVNLKNLVGWWPLNGNPNDYSGNGNDGIPYNSAFFSGTWDDNYTPP